MSHDFSPFVSLSDLNNGHDLLVAGGFHGAAGSCLDRCDSLSSGFASLGIEATFLEKKKEKKPTIHSYQKSTRV